MTDNVNSVPEKEKTEKTNPKGTPGSTPIEPAQPPNHDKEAEYETSNVATQKQKALDTISLWRAFKYRVRMRLEKRRLHNLKITREKSKWTDIATVSLSVVIAGAAIYSAWVFQGQLNTAHEAVEDSNADARSARRHVREQLRISEEQTKAAQDSVNEIQTQTQIGERAWISVGAINLPDPPPMMAGKPFIKRVLWHNTGHTPALDMKVAIVNIVQKSRGKDGEFDLPSFIYKASDYHHTGVLTPNNDTWGDFPISFNQVALDDLDKTIRPYTHGEIRYSDVFGNRHWIRFCYYLVRGGAYAECAYHNDVDRDMK